MISWATIKSLSIFFLPMILPKAYLYYRSARSAPTIAGKPVKSTPVAVSRALAILFAIAFVALVSTLPYFSPENVFSITKSRLQISTDVLFTRLNAIRPHGLTEADNALRQRLASKESRLLYFKYGPDALANCLFCNAEDVRSYFYYSIPAIIIPHLFNICVLALATSGMLVSTEAAVWRTLATIGAITLLALELWIVSSYDHSTNSLTTRVEDIDPFFWTMRIYRGVAIAILDGAVGWVIWLTSTNRAFVTPHTAAERIETAMRAIESTRSRMNAIGVIRNTVTRDDNLRNRSQAYWIHEGKLMGEVMEDREVVEGMNNALENRISVGRITQDADIYAGTVLGLQAEGKKDK